MLGFLPTSLSFQKEQKPLPSGSPVPKNYVFKSNPFLSNTITIDRAVRSESKYFNGVLRQGFIFLCLGCKKEFFVRKDCFKARGITGYCKPCYYKADKGKPYEHLYRKLSLSARSTNKDINLSFEEFLDFTLIKTCHYCDDDITWSDYSYKAKSFAYNLDRKDSNIGYNKSNLVVCCGDCNSTKSNKFTYEEFKELAQLIKTIKLKRKKC